MLQTTLGAGHHEVDDLRKGLENPFSIGGHSWETGPSVEDRETLPDLLHGHDVRQVALVALQHQGHGLWILAQLAEVASQALHRLDVCLLSGDLRIGDEHDSVCSLQDELAGASDGWILLSQDDIAMFTAVSLPTLQRVLRRFSDAGLIEIGYGRLRVLDRAGLKAEAAR